MYSNILPKYYYDKDIFEQEKSIFFNNWIFVGFDHELINHNDFITKQIGNIPVVIQNIHGEVKAFMNVCSHRFSTIQIEEKGNRPLVCPYHGWSFNEEGTPTGIPKKPLFKDFSKKELCELKLKEYSLEKCGNLYFIHINQPKQTLKEFLGEFFDEIELMFANDIKCIDVNKLEIKSNWKIIVENTLESYHVNMVHSDTFKKLGARGLDFKFINNHSMWRSDLNLSEDDPKLEKIHAPFSNRKFKTNGYLHYLIFPNLLISTSYGISFNLSIIHPTSPNSTTFTSNVFLTTPIHENAIVQNYSQSLINFNRQVFDEDKVICEEVQKGVSVTDKPGVLSLEEKRVHHFQETYIKIIQ